MLSRASPHNNFPNQCRSLHPERLVKNSTLTRLEFVAEGTILNLDDNVPSCNRNTQVVNVDVCRIGLQVPTSSRSSISMELWLPLKWEGRRYLATGNGGVDGCIKYEDLAYGTANGFATMGTNNGHNGTTAVTMLHNPDIIEDFSHRALHVGTATAKKIITKFYKQQPDYSYYIGCSLGGRMGIKAAELYPQDYDGIVAGAPTVDFNNLQGQRAMFYTVTGAIGSPDFISADVWSGLIHQEVLKQCDTIDGVKDGIIEIPRKCYFNPSTLLCRPGQTNNCLSATQVEQVRKIYAPYRYPTTGELIFPRMNPGMEERGIERLLSGQPFPHSVEWFRYVVLNDSQWQAEDYHAGLVRLAEQMNPANIRTYPRRLPDFKKHGGKIISYHGGQDQQVTSFNTERFMSHMAEADDELQDYYRYFPVSGMYHCSAGPGAWAFGQGGGAASAGVPFDPEQNVLAAATRWVEEGIAPETMTGTKFLDDNPSQGVDFQRRHCMWPKSQTYIGGDYKLRSSWRCV
ncbi:feruloyl esterase B [Stachybotrys elegans]|uniref:Carboxylic ester hydrolase n=1 Tax=Stachybotrys elegans TaxID=80388 RepID=A0A8K0SR77_9HYPO|nr:feruloyl esterase B [Stachybotrys elegans]